MNPIIFSYGLWIAIDIDNNVLSEGLTPQEAIKNLEGSEQSYYLMFVGENDIPHIYYLN